LVFLARTWVLFIISAASRSSGSSILAIFYPDRHYFYLGLISGSLALGLFILAGRNHDKYRWISQIWQFGYYLLLINIVCDMVLQLHVLHIQHFQYSLSASIQLVSISWIALYTLKSQHLKMCFIRNVIKK
jgi:hypothetical protein